MVIDTMVNDLVTDGGERIEVPENIEVFVSTDGESIAISVNHEVEYLTVDQAFRLSDNILELAHLASES